MTRVIRVCDLLVEAGLIGLLLLTPLPFGSVHPWATSALQAAVGVLAALTVTRMLATREVVIPRHPVLWPALAMAILVAIQVIRPEGSVSPYATWRSAQLYLTLLVLLVVLGAHLVTRARIIRMVSVIVTWGVVLAVVGLVNHALGGTRILWLPKVDYLDRFTSTFVNPNHQALYFSIPLFLALGLLLQIQPQVKFGAAPPRPASTAWQIGGVGRVLLVGAVMVLGVALLLTASRGGVLGALVGLGVLLILTLHRRGSWSLQIGLALAAVAFVGYASGFAMDLLLERVRLVARDPLVDLRWPIWETTIQLVRERPLLGYGLGAFEDAFRVHQPLSIWIMKLVDYAHNDYLQLLAETGVLGALILLWAVVALGVFVIGRWASRRDLFVRSLVMGGLAALTSVAVVSVTDFGLHMPANAVLVVALVALLPAVTTLRLHRSGYRVDLERWRMPLTSTPRVMLTALTLAVSVIVALAPVGPAVADWEFRRTLKIAGGAQWDAGVVTLKDLDDVVQRLHRAARLDPRNPTVQMVLAQTSDELARRMWLGGIGRNGRRLPDASPANRFAASQDLLATAYVAYESSLRERPRASETHEQFAWFLGRLQSIRQVARLGSSDVPIAPALAGAVKTDESLVPRALRHFEEAIRWEPNNAGRHRSFATFALARMDELPDARAIVVQEFRRTLAIDHSMLAAVVDLLSAPKVDPRLLALSVPAEPQLLVELGRDLERRGRRAGASAAFEEAIAAATEPSQLVGVHLAYSQVLKARHEHDAALAQVRQALVLAPKAPEVFATLSEVYEAAQAFSDAETALATAARLADEAVSRRSPEYRTRLASYLTRRGDVERALPLRRREVEERPLDPLAHLEVARLLEARGEWATASHSYRLAGELGSTQPAVQREIGRAYLRHGQLPDAQEAFERALRLAPSTDIRLALAEAYVRSGKSEQAIQQYRRVLSMDPEHEVARRALASLGGAAGGASAKGEVRP